MAEATSQLRRAEQETERAQQSEGAAIGRADRAQAQAAGEVARIRADAQRERDELHTATEARLAALEEARTVLRMRAERAEGDLDTARAENHRLIEQLAKATAGDGEHPHDPNSTPAPRRARKAPATRKPSGSQT